jgi:hypothetical protein
MALKKILKGLEESLKCETKKNPSTWIGSFFHNLKMKSIQTRIDSVKRELIKRKTKK